MSLNLLQEIKALLAENERNMKKEVRKHATLGNDLPNYRRLPDPICPKLSLRSFDNLRTSCQDRQDFTAFSRIS
jgi:hypothetical protein